MVSKLYSSQIRQEVLEALVPKYFDKRVQDEQLKVVGSPNFKDVHFHDGQPPHLQSRVRSLFRKSIWPSIAASKWNTKTPT